MPTKKTFTSAFERLKKISLLLETDETIDIDELVKLQKEARELHNFCNEKLLSASAKIGNN